MSIEESLPATFAKSNMQLLAKELDGRSCITLLAPSGFSKTTLLKFLAKN